MLLAEEEFIAELIRKNINSRLLYFLKEAVYKEKLIFSHKTVKNTLSDLLKEKDDNIELLKEKILEINNIINDKEIEDNKLLNNEPIIKLDLSRWKIKIILGC